jgi:hypothetical protein
MGFRSFRDEYERKCVEQKYKLIKDNPKIDLLIRQIGSIYSWQDGISEAERDLMIVNAIIEYTEKITNNKEEVVDK